MAAENGVSEEAAALRALVQAGSSGAIRQFTHMRELGSWPDESVYLAVHELLRKGAQLVDDPSDPDNTLAWARRRFAAAGHAGRDSTACSRLLHLVMRHSASLGLQQDAESSALGPTTTAQPESSEMASPADATAAILGPHTLPDTLAQTGSDKVVPSGSSNSANDSTTTATPDASGSSSTASSQQWGTSPAADMLTVMKHVLRYSRDQQRRIATHHPHCATAVLTAAAGMGRNMRDVVHLMLTVGASVDGLDLRRLRQRKRVKQRRQVATGTASPMARQGPTPDTPTPTPAASAPPPWENMHVVETAEEASSSQCSQSPTNGAPACSTQTAHTQVATDTGAVAGGNLCNGSEASKQQPHEPSQHASETSDDAVWPGCTKPPIQASKVEQAGGELLQDWSCGTPRPDSNGDCHTRHVPSSAPVLSALNGHKAHGPSANGHLEQAAEDLNAVNSHTEDAADGDGCQAHAAGAAGGLHRNGTDTKPHGKHTTPQLDASSQQPLPSNSSAGSSAQHNGSLSHLAAHANGNHAEDAFSNPFLAIRHSHQRDSEDGSGMQVGQEPGEGEGEGDASGVGGEASQSQVSPLKATLSNPFLVVQQQHQEQLIALASSQAGVNHCVPEPDPLSNPFLAMQQSQVNEEEDEEGEEGVQRSPSSASSPLAERASNPFLMSLVDNEEEEEDSDAQPQQQTQAKQDLSQSSIAPGIGEGVVPNGGVHLQQQQHHHHSHHTHNHHQPFEGRGGTLQRQQQRRQQQQAAAKQHQQQEVAAFAAAAVAAAAAADEGQDVAGWISSQPWGSAVHTDTGYTGQPTWLDFIDDAIVSGGSKTKHQLALLTGQEGDWDEDGEGRDSSPETTPHTSLGENEDVARWVLSPLAQAAAAGDKYVVELLLEVHGANPTAHGRLAERMAIEHGHPDIAKIIFDKSLTRQAELKLSSPQPSTTGVSSKPSLQAPASSYQYVTVGDWLKSQVSSWGAGWQRLWHSGQRFAWKPSQPQYRAPAHLHGAHPAPVVYRSKAGNGSKRVMYMGLAAAGTAALGYLLYGVYHKHADQQSSASGVNRVASTPQAHGTMSNTPSSSTTAGGVGVPTVAP